MGRSVPLLPPEEADSWGEFHARLEREAAGHGRPLTPLWWSIAGLLFGTALVCCAYALQGGRWWLWVCMLGLLGIVGTMAARAVDHADRQRARAIELGRLWDAWDDHVQRGSPTLLPVVRLRGTALTWGRLTPTPLISASRPWPGCTGRTGAGCSRPCWHRRG